MSLFAAKPKESTLDVQGALDELSLFLPLYASDNRRERARNILERLVHDTREATIEEVRD